MTQVSVIFYLGTLVSSIGSFTFNICLVAFMTRAGFDLFHVSLILGLQRLVPVFISGALGHWTDYFSPKRIVVVTELGAAIASLGILWSWSLGHSGYEYLLGFCLLKSSIISFQLGSRTKLTKLFAQNTYQSNSLHAIWFNRVTQGATLFSGLLAWPIIQFFDFQTAIWIDLLTFATNGALVWMTTFSGDSESVTDGTVPSVFTKFNDLYRYNKRAATLDLLLAFAMMGTTSFTARLAGDNQAWVAILIGSYGLSVWIAGFLEVSKTQKTNPIALWCGLGVSFALLGIFSGQGIITLAFALLKDTFYWLLSHRISSHIQMDTPQTVMGSVSSARTTQMVLVLATGELLVGSWSKTIPVFYDGLWRGCFCFILCLVLLLPRCITKERPGYAKL